MNRTNCPSYTLRAATADDLAFLYNVVRVTMWEHVVATWGEWDEEWQRARFTNKFIPERWQVIRADDQDIGGLCIEYRPTELYLSNLHLLPAWQGCGIGTAIVGSLLANAAKRGLPAVTLNVLPSNIGAKRLYERIGFQVVQEDEKHHWLSLVLPSAPKP